MTLSLSGTTSLAGPSLPSRKVRSYDFEFWGVFMSQEVEVGTRKAESGDLVVEIAELDPFCIWSEII